MKNRNTSSCPVCRGTAAGGTTTTANIQNSQLEFHTDTMRRIHPGQTGSDGQVLIPTEHSTGRHTEQKFLFKASNKYMTAVDVPSGGHKDEDRKKVNINIIHPQSIQSDQIQMLS